MSSTTSSPSSSRSASPSPCHGPVVRRPDTGCVVVLGPGILPQDMEHNEKKCKCYAGAKTAGDIERLARQVSSAMEMQVMEQEKPSTALAMLLLGGEVVYQ
ncbi:hypothetical protein F5Y15DRAFT_424223 [Xylariaceae sp. FL0016]|nr:hypothetical protein F5Y15DRAFT_424223 [Xylariaceae sp. FL0016]